MAWRLRGCRAHRLGILAIVAALVGAVKFAGRHQDHVDVGYISRTNVHCLAE